MFTMFTKHAKGNDKFEYNRWKWFFNPHKNPPPKNNSEFWRNMDMFGFFDKHLYNLM